MIAAITTWGEAAFPYILAALTLFSMFVALATLITLSTYGTISLVRSFIKFVEPQSA